MNDCKHVWRKIAAEEWGCVDCEEKFVVPESRLQGWISMQYFIEQLFEEEAPGTGQIHISPISPTTDDKPWLNTTTGKLMKWDGKEWVEV